MRDKIKWQQERKQEKQLEKQLGRQLEKQQEGLSERKEDSFSNLLLNF